MKKVFLFVSFFFLVLTPYLADSTIEVVGTNEGINISGPSTLRKFIRCNMTDSHDHTASCDTDPPSGSHTERTNIPSKVTLTVSGVVSGYGAAGGAFRSAVIDGETVADWDGDVGEQSETLDSVGICGFAGTSAKAYKENKTIDFSVSGDSNETLGTNHQWTATGGIYTRGIEWIGTASSSVEVGLLVDLDETPNLQVSATSSTGTLMKYQQAKDKGWSSTSSNDTWKVVPLYSCSKCGGNSQSSSEWLRLSDAHSHHFICGGCGKHVKCERSRGNHVEVSCPLGPNNETCSYGSYYKCSPHTCAYSGTPSAPTDNTPNCQDCTSDCSTPCSCTNSGTCGGSQASLHPCNIHNTSESGDHSYQASCSSTDENGSYCTGINFYACSHSHTYPDPPANPPTPSPTTIACGAASWTGCSVKSSDGEACLVDPCDSGCGSFYWSCSSGGVSWHKTPRTCKRENCGASYTNRTRGNGTCSNGAYIWHKQ